MKLSYNLNRSRTKWSAKLRSRAKTFCFKSAAHARNVLPGTIVLTPSKADNRKARRALRNG